ncbi:MAG: disulfide bond formation protein DsbC [Terriglobales bacterium]
MRSITVVLVAVAILSAQAMAQESFGRKAPSVTLLPVPVENVTRGKPGTINLQFRVSSGFHINSNTPKQNYLIPTDLKLDPPTDIIVGKIIYPPGVDRSLPFAPDDKLSVYTGPFDLAVTVRPLVSVPPGKYSFRGQLKYQACDNAACYPPKKLPVEFEVRVVKNRVAPRKNPAQSPNVHR